MGKSLDDIIDAHSGDWVDCPDCHGVGQVQRHYGGGYWSDPDTCDRCDGDGKVWKKKT